MMTQFVRQLGLVALCCIGAACANAYDVRFEADFQPDDERVLATISVAQAQGELRSLALRAPVSHYAGFSGDGAIERDGDTVAWQVPAEGGSLTYAVKVDNRRGDADDARLTRDWSILRVGDLFPPALTRTDPGARSRSQLILTGPSDWSFETRYGRVEAGKPVELPADSQRRFIRPTGWMIAGSLGTRREQIAGREVVVSAPLEQGMRRMDYIVFLGFTLPELVKVFPQLPERLLIVGAANDMWRGGLSGPGSFYIHPGRPLVSENSTSTLLHELVHVATGWSAIDGEDWLIEGLAEFYALELLRRAGGLSAQRFELALSGLRTWADEADAKLSDPSSGADTALAVVKLAALHAALPGGLDGWVPTVGEDGPTCEGLNRYAQTNGVDFTCP